MKRRRLSDLLLDAGQDSQAGILFAAGAGVVVATVLAWLVLRLGGVW